MKCCGVQAGRVLRCDAAQEFLDLRDRLAGVEALGAGSRAVHDGVATEHAERVSQAVQAGLGGLVAGIDDPTVSLHEHSRA